LSVRGLAILLVCWACLAAAPAAWGHASLLRSDPADGAMVAAPPAAITLSFNEPVSPLVFRLIGPDGSAVAPAVTAQDTTVTVTPPPLRPGTHALSWRVVSADGHPVGGTLVFSVGIVSERPSVTVGGHRDVRAALWATKVVIYAGLFIGVGGVFFRRWIATTAGADAVMVGALVAGLAASPLALGLQGLDALDLSLAGLAQAAPWRAGFDTAFGQTALVGALALIVGLVALALRPLWPARALALLGLIGVGVALSLSGHAGTVEPRWLTRASVLLHGVCVAFWIGALAPLWVAVRGGEGGRATFARFTRLIPYPLAVIIATGTLLAVVQLGRLDALWTTDYGLVLAGKLVAVAALLGLGVANRYRLVPAFAAGKASASRVLARSIAAELAIALAIFALVALWRFTPPPRTLATPAPISVHLHGARAMAQVELMPRPAGAAVDMLVLDGDLRPLGVKEVTLVLSNPAAAIEPLRRNAAPVGDPADAAWRVEGLRVPLSGRWTLRVEILINDFEKVSLEEQVDLPRVP
jgi:copper transport protein